MELASLSIAEDTDDAAYYSDEARVEAEAWYEHVTCKCLFRWLGHTSHGHTSTHVIGILSMKCGSKLKFA